MSIQQCAAMQVTTPRGQTDIYIKMPDGDYMGMVYDGLPIHSRLKKTIAQLNELHKHGIAPTTHFYECELISWAGSKHKVRPIIFRWDTKTGYPA